MIDFTHGPIQSSSLEKIPVNRNVAPLTDRKATEKESFPLEILSEDEYCYWDNYDSFSQFDEEMFQKTQPIPTVHNHHSDPPPAISINSTKLLLTISSITSPRKSFKPSNDDESNFE